MSVMTTEISQARTPYEQWATFTPISFSRGLPNIIQAGNTTTENTQKMYGISYYILWDFG